MLESGSTIFDCQIVKPLSENDVYQSYLVNCSDSTTAKLLLILPDPLFEQKNRQFFLDHIDRLSSQAFPCVGAPVKAGEVEEQLVCLYPLPPGEPLAQFLNDGFSVRQSVELINKIAECLSAPHSAGFRHGNLSPETIYLEDNSPYLADFSLGQLINLDYHSGINAHYISPEQVRGETSGPAVDIYSLGCVFYHLLTGQPPFSGDDAVAVAMQHLQGKFPNLPKELNVCQPLLDSLTKIIVDERITVDELLKEIGQLSDNSKIDQLHCPVLLDDKQDDAAVSDEDFSSFEKLLDNSEMVARIEARLKKHSAGLQVFTSTDGSKVTNTDATEEPDQSSPEEKSKTGRFMLFLLFGVFIGLALYFLFFNQPTPIPSVLEQTSSNTLMAGLDRGIRLWQDSDLVGAEAEFKGLIEEFPEDLQAYNNLAAIYVSQGNYEQARGYLEQALATDENYATVYHNLGSVYAEMARDSYGRALQLDEMQPLISLQIFSSRGVVDLKPVTGDQATVTTVNESVQVEDVSQSALETTIEIPGEIENINETGVFLNQKSAENFLQRWARAWSNQDMNAYLTFYGESFIPPGGKTRTAWEAQRRIRLTGPKKIMISLDDFQLTPQENNRVRIAVVQRYESDLFVDRSKKVFDLQRTENGWTILRERSLGSIR